MCNVLSLRQYGWKKTGVEQLEKTISDFWYLMISFHFRNKKSVVEDKKANVTNAADTTG